MMMSLKPKISQNKTTTSKHKPTLDTLDDDSLLNTSLYESKNKDISNVYIHH